MMNTTKKQQELVRHLSRLEGQLASVKRELGKANPDCYKASTTLAAASRSFSSLRRSFLECFLDSARKEVRSTKTHEALMRVISS